MNVSYKALCQYLPLVAEYTPQQVADILTSLGLETGSVEEVESIKGGLKGLVVGHVLTCSEHPNSDHLHITTVDVGEGEPLQIVCGAPNVAADQKVIVATIGTVMHHAEGSFTIKKGKLRGVESFGMICSGSEIGVNDDASGIMVLPNHVPAGTLASQYFQLSSDFCLEVDITPNRVDATSHLGVARDLAAYFNRHGHTCSVQWPHTEPLAYSSQNMAGPIAVEVNLPAELCPRYSGITLSGLQNGESPAEIKNFLESIGQRSINLIVDISNYVLHECGQPIHIFDADKVEGNCIKVQQLQPQTKFTTLDGVERTLSGEEIIITNGNDQPLCMAGIFGGTTAEVTMQTTRVFIESANFNATCIRKAARKHALSTDSSFRFERGLDPAATDYALRRTVQLLMQYASAQPQGDAVDLRALPFEEPRCTLSLEQMDKLIGCHIDAEMVKRILNALDIHILNEEGDNWLLKLPVYRTDVRRQADVVEEILRIYGYNETPLSGYIRANLSARSEADEDFQLQKVLSEQLLGAGFNEILSNSLSSEKYYTPLSTYPASKLVHLLNPLSSELGVMRQTLLFGGLEAIERNLNNKQPYCMFYEWGNVYQADANESAKGEIKGYHEDPMLALWICGKVNNDNWNTQPLTLNIFQLKAYTNNLLQRIGIDPNALQVKQTLQADLYTDSLCYFLPSGEKVLTLGNIAPNILKNGVDIQQNVCYAELNTRVAFSYVRGTRLEVGDINKFPAVVRDFALLIDQHISFEEIRQIAFEAAGKMLKEVMLFDVYQGDKLPQGKISYAVRFKLQDETTLTDKKIDKTMARIRTLLEQRIGAAIR